MKSLKKLIIIVTLGTTFMITGCGVTKSQEPAPVKKSLSIYDASQNMRDVLKDMRTEISNKEEDKVIETSDKLEENWKLFEDEIKDKHKDLYENVESPLGVIQAGVKVKPIDTKVLTASIDQLDKVLEQIQNLK